VKVPARIIGQISRRLEPNLAVYADRLTPAHRRLFGPLILAILQASSCYVSDAARELPRLGGSITARLSVDRQARTGSSSSSTARSSG
jgi:hypothetical protein